MRPGGRGRPGAAAARPAYAPGSVSARCAPVNGIDLDVAAHGPENGPLAVLLHGFPELAYSWRHQIPALADAGWRVGRARPARLRALRRPRGDRGPTRSTCSPATSPGCSTHLGAERAVLIGHDWGADLAWKTAWLHPERVRAVAGLSVPFVPRAPAPPLGIMRAHLGEDFYMVWFQEPGVAEAALGRDVRRTLATTRLWDAAWAEETDDDPPTPAFMTEEELAVYVEAFERTGFRGGLNWYRNIDRNWELTARLRRAPHRAARAASSPASATRCGRSCPPRRWTAG